MTALTDKLAEIDSKRAIANLVISGDAAGTSAGTLAAQLQAVVDNSNSQLTASFAAPGGTAKVNGTWFGNAVATVAQLATSIGSSLIGNGTESVADSFNALQLADYTALRAYSGPRKSVYVSASGIAGMFIRDDADTTSTDNGGTVIVASNSKRWKRVTDRIDVRQFGIKDDGTDQTSALVTLLGTTLASLRALVRIPYGVKFTLSTVYAAAAVGLLIEDESSINNGQPPGYKNKIRRLFANDTGADDSAQEVVSSHHPCLRLNNLHTAGTASATSSYHSIIYSHGYRWNGDPIDGMQHLTKISPRGNLWRTSWVLNTPYDYAANGAAQWTASTAYALNAMVNTSDGNVYKATVAGTSGTTKPTHTSGTATDGTVTWQYLGKWVSAITTMYFDEDGYGALAGSSTARFGVETATKKGLSLNADESSGDTYLRDDQRAQDLWRRSTAKGMQAGPIISRTYGGSISGATPTISAELHYVNNASATNMTDILLPTGQTDGVIELQFANANTTLKWSGSNFSYLKGSVDVTPPSGGVMIFRKTNVLSGGWFEIHRNF